MIKLSDNDGTKFEEAHAFIGYQKDTPAAVIFQATNQLKILVEGGDTYISHLQQAGILSSELIKELKNSSKDSSQWSKAVIIRKSC